MQVVIDDMKTGYKPPSDIPFEESGKPVAVTKKQKQAGTSLFGGRRPKVEKALVLFCIVFGAS